MKRTSLSRVVIASCMFLLSTGWAFAQDWPGWRGDGRGISPEKNLPLKWSENEGIKRPRNNNVNNFYFRFRGDRV